MLGLLMFLFIQVSIFSAIYKKHYLFKHKILYRFTLAIHQPNSIHNLNNLHSIIQLWSNQDFHNSPPAKSQCSVSITYMKCHFNHKNIIISTWHILSFRAQEAPPQTTFITLGVLDVLCLLAPHRIYVAARHFPCSLYTLVTYIIHST